MWEAVSEGGSAIRPLRPVTLVLLLVVLPAPLRPPRLVADVVHLKAGRVLEGEVGDVETDGVVEVRIGGGATVRVDRSEVLRIDRKPSPMQLFDARFENVAAGEIEPLVELLVMAREKRLRGRARKAAEHILRIDPNHELARWTLGYVVFRNRWALEADLRQRGDLVRVDGEWMTRDDEKRRHSEEARREVEELLTLVESENGRILGYAVKELGRRVTSRDPAAIEVLGERLVDRRLAVRLVAAAELGHVRVDASDAGPFRADRIARQLHRLAMTETSPEIRQLLHGTGSRQGTLATFHPQESFRLALAESASATASQEIERIAEILVTAAKKAWMPELCRAAAAGDGNPAARLALKRILRVDLGFDASRWLDEWERRRGEFQDVE